MTNSICFHLMFDGHAEQAANFYTRLFAGGEILDLQRYGEGEQEGKLLAASFRLAGQDFIAIDSPVEQEFDFTPSMSIFVTCDSKAELDRLCEALSEGGEFLMPPDNYGFSRKFTWLTDRWNVSWQLNLEA